MYLWYLWCCPFATSLLSAHLRCRSLGSIGGNEFIHWYESLRLRRRYSGCVDINKDHTEWYRSLLTYNQRNNSIAPSNATHEFGQVMSYQQGGCAAPEYPNLSIAAPYAERGRPRPRELCDEHMRPVLQPLPSHEVPLMGQHYSLLFLQVASILIPSSCSSWRRARSRHVWVPLARAIAETQPQLGQIEHGSLQWKMIFLFQ